MASIATNEFRPGVKIEIEGQPYVMVTNQFVKPGKGNAINRTKLKHLVNGRVLEKTFKSGDSVPLADVNETKMRMLYQDADGFVFMDDSSYEQITIPFDAIGDTQKWLIEDLVYDIIFWRGSPINVEPPTFLELKITETAPGVRGDTASGRVLKPAEVQGGATIQVPIFLDEGEVIKVDTRSGEYVSRVKQ